MNKLRPAHATLIATASCLGVIVLWLERVSGSSFDQTLHISTGSLWADAALVISAFTSPVTVLAVVILSGLFAAYEHHAKIWWLLSVLLLSTTAVSMLLKQLLVLPRPEAGLIQLSSYGFPSTHAVLATVLFVVGSWFFVWLEGQVRTRVVLIIGLGWLAICSSRVVLGVHSISDVLGGILIGLAVGTLAVSLAPRIFTYLKIKRFSFN